MDKITDLMSEAKTRRPKPIAEADSNKTLGQVSAKAFEKEFKDQIKQARRNLERAVKLSKDSPVKLDIDLNKVIQALKKVK